MFLYRLATLPIEQPQVDSQIHDLTNEQKTRIMRYHPDRVFRDENLRTRLSKWSAAWLTKHSR